MTKRQRLTTILVAMAALLISATATAKKGTKTTGPDKESGSSAPTVLWRSPGNIQSRNLFYGSGGEAHAPHTTYTFEKEDLEGTSPKFIVHDENGVKWKVKMGHEAHSETVASRFLWAAGYSTNEDYYLQKLRVEGMPPHLHRGQQFVDSQGVARDVRLKRYLEGEKKAGIWKWSDNPFSNTRELNGLRVVMALINNWDTKDINNAINYEKHPEASSGPENIYMVSDLGASFGTTGVTWKRGGADGILQSYRNSKFILRRTEAYADFATPSRPLLLDIFDPPDFFMRVHMRWIGRRIPRADVQWMGHLLAQLSSEQIRDAFRAGGYTPEEVEGFSKVVEGRIALLNKL